MTAQSSKTHLIVGGNRGIGLALVKGLSESADNIVIATTRNLDSKASTELNAWKSSHSNVHVVAAETTDVKTLHAAATSLKELGVTQLDTIVVNAGVLTEAQDLVTITKETFFYGIEVNTLGPILVYQAFHTLLTDPEKKSVFAIISSEAGNSENPLAIPNIAYTTSKAAANHVAAQINLNAKSALALAIHPGLVETDMATSGAEALGMNVASLGEAFDLEVLSPKQSATAILKVIQAPDVEKYAGKFVSYNGSILPW